MRAAVFRCDGCGHVMVEADVLTVYIDHPKPGHDRVSVAQCPECGECEQFTNLCDEPGCKHEASSGWPTKDGDYRRTCHAHWAAHERDRAK